MASPAVAAAAMATTRRAVVVGTSFMMINPVVLGFVRSLRRRYLVSGWRQTGAVTGRAELIRRAEAHGVAVSYCDWRGRVVDVSDQTLAAVLEVLGNGRSYRGADGYVGRDAKAPFPARRSWGFAVQLY